MAMDTQRLRQIVTTMLILSLFSAVLILLLASIEVAPVCVDPGARIERDRILDCHAWEDRPTIQVQF